MANLIVNQEPAWQSKRAGYENNKPGIRPEDFVLSEKHYKEAILYIELLIKKQSTA